MVELSQEDYTRMEELYTKYIRYDKPPDEARVFMDTFYEMRKYYLISRRLEDAITVLKETDIMTLLESSNDSNAKKACKHLKAFLSNFKDY